MTSKYIAKCLCVYFFPWISQVDSVISINGLNLLDSGWPLVWKIWKTWKCQGIWQMWGNCRGKLYVLTGHQVVPGGPKNVPNLSHGIIQQSKSKKGKVFPYSSLSVGPGADPGVQAVSPQVTWSGSRHIPSSSLPLLFARPAFTFVALSRWRYL